MNKQIAKVEMTMKRQTKGAVLYEAVQRPGNGSDLTNVYVRKSAFADGNFPGTITVTVSVDGDGAGA